MGKMYIINKSRIIAFSFWGLILVLFVFIFTAGVPQFGPISKIDICSATSEDTAETLASITNADPTISFDSQETPITLTQDSSTTVAHATTTATDNNGWDGIASVSAVFYDKGASEDKDCGADGQNCYTGISCVAGATTATTRKYACSANLWHYSNASTEWEWYALVTDNDSATGSATSGAVTVNELVAIDITETSIDYGEVALDATSSQDSVTVENIGCRDNMDVGIKQTTALTCTVGSLAADRQAYSTTTGFAFGEGTQLTSSYIALNIDLSQGSDTTHVPTTSMFWRLQTTSTGVGGSCTGTNAFQAGGA